MKAELVRLRALELAVETPRNKPGIAPDQIAKIREFIFLLDQLDRGDAVLAVRAA